MFSQTAESLQDGRVIKFTLRRHEAVLSYRDVISLWQDDRTFRSFFIDLLAEAPFDTYRWETPAVDQRTADQPFEFVLIDHPGLAAFPDQFTFRGHYVSVDENTGVAVFKNLGGDAILVVPSPLSSSDAFSHLARFTRTATEAQNHALWQTVGREMAGRVGKKPVWLNTAGDGVSWLHIRLDDRPKYYHYRPYRQA